MACSKNGLPVAQATRLSVRRLAGRTGATARANRLGLFASLPRGSSGRRVADRGAGQMERNKRHLCILCLFVAHDSVFFLAAKVVFSLPVFVDSNRKAGAFSFRFSSIGVARA